MRSNAERNVVMKGIVLSLGLPRKRRFCLPDLKGIIKRHGVLMVFAALLLAGLALGAAYACSADRQTLRSLDFLFTTNLDSRLGKGAFGTMCACFASDFVFLLSAYLLGAAPWGIPFLPALVCFKGFGTGITAGYLALSHGVSGAGFYLLVLLPGTFLFCAALIVFSVRAFAFSRQTLKRLLSRQPALCSLREALLHYSSRFLSALGVTFAASLLDTLLWTLFAGTFHF